MRAAMDPRSIASHLLENLDLPAVYEHVQRTYAPTLIAHAILAFTLAYIPPRERLVRLAATGLILASCLETIRRCSLRTYESSSYADYMFGLAFHANCYLTLLNRSPPPTVTGAWSKLQWGINALFSPRMDVKPYRRGPPNTTKAQFLARRLLVATLIGTFWLYIRDGQHFSPPNTDYHDWAPSKTHMLPQILTNTLTLRAIHFRLSLAFYAHASSALTICLGHTLCALLAVGLFNSPPQTWPPLFGNILHAYTLRRWYSHFWHQAMRKAFTLHAAALTSHIPHLRSHPATNRAAILLLSFLASGIMHTLTSDVSSPCADPFATVKLFLLLGVAILLEQVVQNAYVAVYEGLGVPWTRVEGLFWRGVGYVWVVYYMLEFTVEGSFRYLQCEQPGGD